MTISLIKTDGSGDYTSIQAWEDACPSDITASGTNENWEGELFNEEFLNSEGECTFGGITTDATHQLLLRPVTGGGFADNADPTSDPLRYNASLGASIRSTTAYVQMLDFGSSSSVRCTITGIQMKATDSLARCIDNLTHSQPLMIKGCYLEGAGTSSTGAHVLRLGESSGTKSIVSNSVLINTTGGVALIESEAGYQFVTFYSNSSTDYVRGSNYDPATYKNCLFLNGSTFQNDGEDNTVDFCVSDLASWESSTALNSVLNATAANEIENDSGSASTVDLRAKAGGDSDGGGTNISGITTDIYGQTRDVSTPTVGAFEIVSVGGLVVQDLSVSTSLTSPTLTQHNSLAVDNLSVATSLTEPNLSQNNALAVDGLASSTSLTEPVLAQHNVLSTDDLTSSTALTEPSLTQRNILVVDDLASSTALTSPVFVQQNALSVDSLTSATSLTEVTLSIAGALAVASLGVGTSLSEAGLTQHNILLVDSLAVASSLSNASLAGTIALAVNDLAVGTSISQPTLDVAFSILVDNLSVGTSISESTFTQHNVLLVDDMSVDTLLSIVSLGGVVISCFSGYVTIEPQFSGHTTIEPAFSGYVKID